jgi:predicted NodU family carbamoyl transferase
MLGISAALIVDSELVAAAQEERFKRRKHDPGFLQMR